MTKKIIATIVVIIVGIGIYLIIPKNLPSAGPTVQDSAIKGAQLPQTETASTSGITVDIKNFSFNPGALTIKVGTKVTWTNNDSAPHTVTSSNTDGPLNSGTLTTGKSFSFTFSEIGSFDYYCTIHPMMKGSIKVTE
ncbi:MAG: cupredoxin family copper-binding protein [Candidatus Jorgensenbacteria bacterium]|nr:cupredoxin family copper-binding protein [Candidatus Jorgensenbacteria bacterium]